MTTAIQLNLFSPPEPAWEDITIEWLFNYLNSQYPEMKFTTKEHVGWSKFIKITQNMHNRIELYLYVGKHDKDAVTDNKGLIYIGYSYGKEYGDYHHRCGSIDSMEELKKELPIFIKKCKDYVEEYKKNRKKSEDI